MAFQVLAVASLQLGSPCGLLPCLRSGSGWRTQPLLRNGSSIHLDQRESPVPFAHLDLPALSSGHGRPRISHVQICPIAVCIEGSFLASADDNEGAPPIT